MTLTERSIAGRRCVVLGAGGFVGSNLCRHLTKAGADVVGYGHPPRVGGRHIPWIAGEFEDSRAIANVVDGADIVFHLLGGSNPTASNRDPSAELQAALSNNLGVVSAACDAKVSKLVFVSSGGTIYGTAACPLKEDNPVNPISAYGLGKLMVEKLLHLYHSIHSLDYTVLRVSNPYGRFQMPDRSQGFVATVVQRALDHKPLELWGDGSVVRDYIHIDDVCTALISAALTNTEHRVFNIGSGVGRSLKDVVRDVSHVIGSDVAVRYLPGRPADIPVNVLDCTRADVILDWRPAISWEDGLRSTAAWLSGLDR
jgi:UDP-glucose 4-epimerase